MNILAWTLRHNNPHRLSFDIGSQLKSIIVDRIKILEPEIKMNKFQAETDRLLLRDLAPDDFAQIHEYAAMKEVVRYMEWGPNTEDDTRLFLEESIAANAKIPRLDFELAIVLKTENKIIGGGGIHVSNRANNEGWIGYCFNENYWGKGYATEMATAIVKFGFEELCLNRIFATTAPGNKGSQNVLSKLAMKHEGTMREHKLVRGKYRDTELFAVLRRDFQSSREP